MTFFYDHLYITFITYYQTRWSSPCRPASRTIFLPSDLLLLSHLFGRPRFWPASYLAIQQASYRATQIAGVSTHLSATTGDTPTELC